MQACVDRVLIIFGTQVINKKRPVRPAFPDYLSVSYDYAGIGTGLLANDYMKLAQILNSYHCTKNEVFQ